MPKKTRKEKREEERRIIEEFEAALKEERGETPEEGALRSVGEEETGEQPKILHCKRCKTEMVNGKCPVCGFTVYQPMDEKKRQKIKGILTAVLLGVFIAVFVLMQLK